MRKFTSALAVAGLLTVPVMVSAQTSLTPYLVADVSVGYITNASKHLPMSNDYDYMSNNIASSVYGLRASHDLGNGLIATGNLEGDFNTSTGDHEPAGMFRRAANVGLRGSFGHVEFGTKTNPLIAFNATSYAMGGQSVSTNTAIAMGYANFFTNKSITYTTKVNGLTAQVQYGFENLAPGGPFGYARESMVSGYARYDFGAFNIGAAAQNVQGVAGITADKTTYIIGAGAKFDALTLKAMYIDNDDIDASVSVAGHQKNTAYQLGASYAFTPRFTAGTDFILHDSDSYLLSLQGRYALHKNVMTYVLVSHVDNDAEGATFAALRGAPGQYSGLTGKSETGVAVGMVVRF